MTDFFSSHFGPAPGETGHFTTQSVPNPLVSAGERHGRVRHSHAHILIPSATNMGDNDNIMLFGVKSSDRIGEIYIYHDLDFGSTTTFNVGFHKLNSDNTVGDEIDEDLFESAVDRAAAITRANGSVWLESTTLDDMDRWKTAWALATVGGKSYTEDPVEDWVLTMRTSQDITVTASAELRLQAEIWYKSGD